MAETIEALVKQSEVKALAIKADITQLAADARALEVVDVDSMGKAGDILKILKAKKTWLDEDRKTLTGPLDAAKTAIMGKYKPQIEECDLLIKTLDRKTLIFAQAEDSRRRAEEKKRRDEELALLEAQKKDVLDAAAESGDEDLLKAAEEIEAQQTFVNQAPVEIVKVKGAGSMSTVQYRDNWRFEVLDESAVPVIFKSTDKDKVNDRIKQILKGNENLKGTKELTGKDSIPGLRVYNEPSSVSR